MQLRNIDSWFTLMRLSWKNQRLRFHVLDNIEQPFRGHLINLITLNEFFIPVVIFIYLYSFLFFLGAGLWNDHS